MEHVDKLKHTGLKATLPRLRVLELFQHSEQRHLAAEDVYRQMMQHGTDIGLATIYRVLAQLEQAGLLKRSQLGVNRAVYELNDGEPQHGHLVSLTDGQVHEFFDPQIEQRLAAIAQDKGYDLADYVITVFARPYAAVMEPDTQGD
ncbi:MAG: transcriptional repressor [Acidovorax sp.]